MANGRPFDPEAFTAAHASLPLGTLVRVVAAESRQGVVAEITDRMPRRPGRVLLLSEAAARAIGLHEMGVADIEFERLTSPPPLPPPPTQRQRRQHRRRTDLADRPRAGNRPVGTGIVAAADRCRRGGSS